MACTTMGSSSDKNKNPESALTAFCFGENYRGCFTAWIANLVKFFFLWLMKFADSNKELLVPHQARTSSTMTSHDIHAPYII